MADVAIAPGSIWRAKSRFAAMEAIRIVSVTENRRVLLVEWIRVGSEFQMRADVIRSDYAPSGHGPAIARPGAHRRSPPRS